jgi:type VI secretion system protein ImpC
MAQPLDFGEIKLTAGRDDSSAHPNEGTPFRIALLADFSGRPSRARTGNRLANSRTLLVDRDNFDSVPAKLGSEVNLPIGGNSALTVRFSELEDFHPDRLFERTEMFRRQRDVRLRLQDPLLLQRLLMS